MIGLSDRYLAPLLAVLLLAAVPVTAHHWVGMPNEDCADPDAMRSLAIGGGTLIGEFRDKYDYAISQYTRGEKGGARFQVVRSVYPQQFFGERPLHMPGFQIDAASHIEVLRVDGAELPIRVWQRTEMGIAHVAAYLMIYRGEPMASVLRPSVRHAFDALIHGPLPVTFIGIDGYGPAPVAEDLRREFFGWLGAAWTHYRRVCG